MKVSLARLWLVFLLTLAATPFFCANAQVAPLAETEQSVSPGDEMDLGAYLAELDRLSAALAGLDRRPSEIPIVRRSLPKSWHVRAAGQRSDVSLGWLDSALETLEKNPAVRASLQTDIQIHLRAMRQQAEALQAGSALADPAAARARLDAILSRREFRAVREPNWWDRAVARFWMWVASLWQRLFGSLFGRPRVGAIVVWSVIALVFILLALWLRRRMLRAANSASLRLPDALPVGKTWRDWAQEALAAAARENYREAVHAAYWAGVYRLAELGVWQLERARTPREYVRLLAQSAATQGASPFRDAQVVKSEERAAPPAGHAERAAALAALTQRLELTWYGYQPATAGDFREAVLKLEALGCRFPSNLATASC